MAGMRQIERELEAAEAMNRQTASIAGLAVTLAVLVVCVFLVKHIAIATSAEDCLMSGRTNCDIVANVAR